jgi:hypothetical protein
MIGISQVSSCPVLSSDSRVSECLAFESSNPTDLYTIKSRVFVLIVMFPQIPVVLFPGSLDSQDQDILKGGN